MRKQSGFTLIEIAIVLVIIGLLIGGTLKGQEMIENSKIKNLRNDFEGIAAAVYAYQDRYQRVPGDDPRATRWTGATAGNGDGDLEDNSDAFSAGAIGAHERRYFWQQLRYAGLLKGDPGDTEHPHHAFGGQFGVVTGNGTAPLGLTGTVVLCASMVPMKAAEAIDAQLDDGIPNTGTVRADAVTGSTDPGNSAASAEAAYTDTTGSHYALCKAL